MSEATNHNGHFSPETNVKTTLSPVGIDITLLGMALVNLSSRAVRFLKWIRAGFVLAMFSAAGIHAQELEPRLYTNTPIGMNFIVLGYGYSQGTVIADPSVPLENASIKIHGPVLGYARSVNLGGMSGKIDSILSYVCASGSAELAGERMERNVCGLIDPRFRLSVNLYGAPALTLKEFASYKQDIIVGASMQVGVPLGQYDPDKLVNIGTNRWFIKTEAGVSKALGPLIVELAAGVTFYTPNDNFLGGKEKEQDPLFSLQGHLVYGFKSGVWVAVDGTYYRGGQTTIDGVNSDDLQANSRIGLTLALPVNRHNSIKLFGSTGATARAGGDFDTVGIVWQYRWGAGL
ncbi:MAG: transporter [Thermodesulfobacteriota bacterium]